MEHPKDYEVAYDLKVLEIGEIEESPTGSAKDMNQIDPFLSPDGLSTIKVTDLLSLVNRNVKIYGVKIMKETEK